MSSFSMLKIYCTGWLVELIMKENFPFEWKTTEKQPSLVASRVRVHSCLLWFKNILFLGKVNIKGDHKMLWPNKMRLRKIRVRVKKVKVTIFMEE